VTDSGPGFDPSPVKARGTLGLTLIEDLSQQMRGELTLESEGLGARWILTAPRGPASRLSNSAAASASSQTTPTQSAEPA
ncbi:MAG: hypothetical protein AAF205_11290, partial [Pseudomonadota bacterium]